LGRAQGVFELSGFGAVLTSAGMSALDGVYRKIDRAIVHQVDLAQRLAEVLGPDK